LKPKEGKSLASSEVYWRVQALDRPQHEVEARHKLDPEIHGYTLTR
jgi:hypothetical protein